METAPLVLGAGGFLGLNLVDAMLARGARPVCGIRRAAPRVALKRRAVPTVHADLDDADSLVSAMAGRRLVYHLAAHYPPLSLDREATLDLGMGQLHRVLEAAATAGVERLVFVSSTATVAPASGRASTEGDVFPVAPGHGVYHDLKWAMEQRVLAEDRVHTVVAVPGGCLGPWDLRIGTSALLVTLARGLEPALPDGTVNLVDARDVAEATLALGTRTHPPRRVLVVAENHQLFPLMARLARRYGVPGPRLLSPEAAIATADAEEARAAVEGGRAMLSREIVDLILSGVPIDASLSREALGVRYRPLDETLDDYDAWARARRIIPKPSPGSHP